MVRWIDVMRYAREANPKPDKYILRTEEEWKERLTEEEYAITRLSGTERPHSSELCSLFEEGEYSCVCCETPLFQSYNKFDSGTGWPSFSQPIKWNAVSYHRDDSLPERARIEVKCNACEAHLGHVFKDGPEPSGLRYCINAIALKKINSMLMKATLGGGCFWCSEAVFMALNGVDKVVSGYSGGKIVNPTYHDVCTGVTGHAECVQITYDPDLISYADLLRIHLTTHDPTQLNRQGADVGTQYRSIIFTQSPEQRDIALNTIEELALHFDRPIVTVVEDLVIFYEAEDYHQNYFHSNPQNTYCSIVIGPKLEKFRKLYGDKLK